MYTRSSIQIDHLIRHDPGQADSVVELYADTVSERGRGDQCLTLIIELTPRRTAERPWYQHIADTLLQNATDAFRTGEQETPELILEDIIDALNVTIASLFAKRRESFEALTMLVGLTEHGQVHFTQVGRVRALLTHGATMTDIAERQESSSILKTFTHITSGLLNPGDSLLLTTDTLADYIAKDKLRTLAQKFPPHLLVAELSGLLTGAPPTTSFAAIIIKFATDLDALAARQSHSRAPAQPQQEEYLEAYPESLRESWTRQTPQLITPLQSVVRQIRLGAFARFVGRAILAYGHYLLHITGSTFKAVRAVLRMMLNRSIRVREEHMVLATIAKHLTVVADSVRKETNPKRIATTLLIATILLLIHSLVWQSLRQTEQRAYAAFEDLVSAVASGQKEADTAVIYNDEKRAETILQETLMLLQGFPSRDETQNMQLKRYIDEIERRLQEIRNITLIEQPLILADLSAELTGPVQSLIIDNDSFLIAADRDMYRLQDNKLTPMGSTDDSLIDLFRAGDTVLALSKTGSLFHIKKDAVDKLSFTRSPNNKTSTAVTTYAGNIYILDAPAGTLFKYTGSGLQFSNGSVWLQDQNALNEGVSIAADGAIYVLQKSGVISKLLRGAPQQFSAEKPTPALGEATYVHTTKDSNYIYVADPINGRLIIYNKDGSIKNQLVSRAFEGFGGFAADAKEETLYIASGEKIFAVALK